MLAAIELPSVIRFPWAGALILGVFAAVAVAAVAVDKLFIFAWCVRGLGKSEGE